MDEWVGWMGGCDGWMGGIDWCDGWMGGWRLMYGLWGMDGWE